MVYIFIHENLIFHQSAPLRIDRIYSCLLNYPALAAFIAPVTNISCFSGSFGGPGTLPSVLAAKCDTSTCSTLTSDVSTLNTDVSALKTDTATLKTDVSTLNTDVATLKTDVATLNSDVPTLKSDVATLKADTATLKTDVSTLNTDVSTIKSCFTDPTAAGCTGMEHGVP